MTVMWKGRYIEAVVEDGWEWVRRPGTMSAAVVLPVTDDGEVVLVEERRAAFGRPVLGLVAGLIGDGVGGDTPAEAAARELVEEAGYEARHWRAVGEFAASPGMSSETYHFFIATGLSRVGAGGGVGREEITVHHVPLGAVAAFVTAARARGCVVDGKMLSLLAFADR